MAPKSVFRNGFGIKHAVQLQHEVEIDETYVGGKNKNRHFKKKVRNAQGRSFKDKVPVLGMIERNGKVIAKTVTSVSSNALTPIVLNVITPNAKVYTDEWKGYNDLKKTYQHNIVRHCIGEYVNGNAHTNTIEGFWSLLKRGIISIYHVVSKKHLQVYIDEYAFRYNTRKLIGDRRFCILLGNMENRLTYKRLVYG